NSSCSFWLLRPRPVSAAQAQELLLLLRWYLSLISSSCLRSTNFIQLGRLCRTSSRLRLARLPGLSSHSPAGEQRIPRRRQRALIRRRVHSKFLHRRRPKRSPPKAPKFAGAP